MFQWSWFVIVVISCLLWQQHIREQPWLRSRKLLESGKDITELGGVTAKSFRDLILQSQQSIGGTKGLSRQSGFENQGVSNLKAPVTNVSPTVAITMTPTQTKTRKEMQINEELRNQTKDVQINPDKAGNIDNSGVVVKMTGSKLIDGPDHDFNDPKPRQYSYTSTFKPIRGRLPDDIVEDKRLLHYAMRQIENSEDIVYINGPRGKRLWDLNNPNPHGLINDRLRIRKWEQIATVINTTLALSQFSTNAVHVHNEMKIGDLLLVLVDEYRRNLKIPLPKPAEPILFDKAVMHRMMDYGQPPIVVTNSIDENWGFLSTFIANRTTKWINMTNHLRIHYSSYDTFKDFIDSEKVLLMFCSSHVDPVIGAHKKILSLPLGIKARSYGFARAQLFKELAYNKTKLLTINNSGWGPRTSINEMVARSFDYTVRNSYSHSRKKGEFKDRNGQTTFMDHLLEIAQSKFVLCPSGLGYDTYRMWEVIMVGSIPVVESNAGFDRTYSSLPVLVVQHYEYLTPELLMKAYPCFMKHAHEFKYEMLREDYWVNLFQTAVVTGSIDHVTENHPFRHKYCDFLDYRPK